MRNKVVSTLAFFLLYVMLGCKSSLWAQTADTGALRGTLADPSGSSVSGAAVTLIDNATSRTLTTTTGPDGTYRFSLLPPGSYTLRFSAQGFKTTEIKSVTVNITETPVQDAKLEVGATAQQVTVTGEAPIVQTETSALGTLVEGSTIAAIPLTTRNYTQILSLSAGVSAGVNNAANLGRGSVNMSVNGRPTGANNYQLDGADANSWAFHDTAEAFGAQAGGLSVPNPDAIAEFKVQTGIYDSGYGRNTGANVNVVTKSGTNEFHGTLFEFLRNTALNANDFFLNSTGQPRGEMKQNQFGGVLGGPIKKDKLFIFGSFQETRQINGLFNSSNSSSFQTAILPPLTDSNRTAPALGALYCTKPTFAGGVQVACDGSNINPIALKIIQAKLPDGRFLIPNPQTILTSGPNAGQGFSAFSRPATFNEHQVILNTDYVISSKHTLSEKYFWSRDPENISFVAPTNVPGFPQVVLLQNNDGGLTLTSTLTQHVVNEAKATYNRIWSEGASQGPIQSSLWGIAPINPLTFPVVPAVLIGPFALFGGGSSDTFGYMNQLQFTDQISWVKGKHTFRFGGLFEQLGEHLTIKGRSRGGIVFQTFQDFLLGMSAAQNGSPSGQSNIFCIFCRGAADATQFITGVSDGTGYIIRENYAAVFVQDDFKATPRLTLNLGLRWDYIGNMYEPNGKLGAIIPALMKQVPIPPASGSRVGFTVPSNYNPATFGLPDGVFVRPVNGVSLSPAPWTNFAPRLGFAWQPGVRQTRLVVRGGYGIFYDLISAQGIVSPTVTSPPFGFTIARLGASNGAATLADPPQYPGGVLTLGFPLRTPTSTRTDGGYDPVQRNPMVQQFSLNLEYGLSPGMALEVAYVGSYGTRQQLTIPINQPGLASATNPVNCGYDGVPTDCIATNTTTNAAQRVPVLGETPTALGALGFRGFSWYNGMQVTLRKRLSHGVTFQAAYTWSKAEASAVFNDVTKIDRARSSIDRTQRLIVNYSWQLPSPFREGIGGKLVNGWSVSGVMTAQGGNPLSLTDQTGGSIYGRTGSSTVQLCPSNVKEELKNTSGNDVARLSSWFNKAAICSPPTIGNGRGYGNTGQFIVDGPGQFNWDIALIKATRVGGIHEASELQFRTEFYNAFNHAQFTNPGTTFGQPTFGVITSTSVAARLIQFGLKYSF